MSWEHRSAGAYSFLFVSIFALIRGIIRKREDWRTRRDRTELRNHGFESQMTAMVDGYNYIRYCAGLELGVCAHPSPATVPPPAPPSPPPTTTTPSSPRQRHPRMEEVDDEGDLPSATPMEGVEVPRQEVYQITVVDMFGGSLVVFFLPIADLGCRDECPSGEAHQIRRDCPCLDC